MMKIKIVILISITVIGVIASFLIGGILDGLKGAVLGTLFGFLLFGYLPVYLFKQIKLWKDIPEEMGKFGIFEWTANLLGPILVGGILGFIFGYYILDFGVAGAILVAIISFVVIEVISPFREPRRRFLDLDE